MYADFFQIQSLAANRYIGIYDFRLITLSFLVAVFASYIALDLTARLRDPNNSYKTNISWLFGGAVAMGSGIWSMHFIGMLSFSIPGVTLAYDLFWTIISLLVAIIASSFALFLLKTSFFNLVHLIAGGVILGLGIASMHYTGMAGMLISLNIRYLPGLFFLSILIAIVASEAAIYLALKSNAVVLRLRTRIKLTSAIIMGFAICGMHYTGMVASVFTPLCNPVVSSANALDPSILSMIVATVTFLILSVAFFASSYQESLNQDRYERVRELNKAEISASILHNVGNVLNSVNVSVTDITEKISSSQLIGLEKIRTLLNEHKHDLGDFVTRDPRGSYTLDFINKLADYWRDEKKHITTELSGLTKNLILIQDIISTQQSLNTTSGFVQIVSIKELIDEAQLIAGLNTETEITVKKQYEKNDTMSIDKVKLLQVIVNLLQNAKHALLESSNVNKTLVIETHLVDKKTIEIKISDNGIGIPPANLTKIFTFGFTTKKNGHGFGLHNSALAINELGGSIHVTSDGLEQGTTFTLHLIYKP